MRRRKMIDQGGLQTAAAWCAGCAIGYLMLSLLGGILGQTLLTKWLNGAGAGSTLAHLEWVAWWGNLLFSAAALLIPVGFAVVVGGLPVYQLRCRLPRRNVTAPALVAYLAASQIVGVIAGFVGKVTGSVNTPITLPESTAARVLAFLVVCVIPALLEELLFRGVMQGILRTYGLWLAIVGQAVPFALLHGNLSSAVFAFAAGIFLGWLAERSGSILPGMILHFVNNALAFTQLILIQNGAQSVAEVIATISLLVFPVLGIAVLVWWIRQGFWMQKLERVPRIGRLLYSVPWVVAQIFLLIYCIFMA